MISRDIHVVPESIELVISIEGVFQQTRYINPMLVQYWPIVYDTGPTMNQHWVDVSCFLGYVILRNYFNYQQLVPLAANKTHYIV